MVSFDFFHKTVSYNFVPSKRQSSKDLANAAQLNQYYFQQLWQEFDSDELMSCRFRFLKKRAAMVSTIYVIQKKLVGILIDILWSALSEMHLFLSFGVLTLRSTPGGSRRSCKQLLTVFCFIWYRTSTKWSNVTLRIVQWSDCAHLMNSERQQWQWPHWLPSSICRVDIKLFINPCRTEYLF